jgi:hypothetical protein
MEERSLAVMDMAVVPVKRLKEQVAVIQQAMKEIMVEDVHYGIVPGTKQPALLKPGAEKIAMMFRMIPQLEVRETADPGGKVGHREYNVTVTLRDPAGNYLGQGVGLCSTCETKYRYRFAERKCPHCGKEAIAKGRDEYGGGWYCNIKKGGCGLKFAENEPLIMKQARGKVENADIADCFNTVLKMAKKRAMVDAVITATGVSDMFGQDTDEEHLVPAEEAPPPPEPPYNPAPPPTNGHAQAGQVAQAKLFKYNLESLEFDKQGAAEQLLKAAGASQFSDFVWMSPTEVKKLVRFEEKEAA